TGRILSSSIPVAIGLISYSLYLWHWPLLVLAAYWFVRPLTTAEGLVVVAAAVLLATASWRFVEQPFRRRSVLSPRLLFAGTAAGVLVFAGIAGASIVYRGFPARVPDEVRRLEAFENDVSPKRLACHDGSKFVPPEHACVFGAAVPPTVAVWGDS